MFIVSPVEAELKCYITALRKNIREEEKKVGTRIQRLKDLSSARLGTERSTLNYLVTYFILSMAVLAV